MGWADGVPNVSVPWNIRKDQPLFLIIPLLKRHRVRWADIYRKREWEREQESTMRYYYISVVSEQQFWGLLLQSTCMWVCCVYEVWGISVYKSERATYIHTKHSASRTKKCTKMWKKSNAVLEMKIRMAVFMPNIRACTTANNNCSNNDDKGVGCLGIGIWHTHTPVWVIAVVYTFPIISHKSSFWDVVGA